MVNGRKSAPGSQVTKVLNGPSCSGSLVGDDVVGKDYLNVRPDPQRTISELYTNPALKKQ